ncbi:Uma2 family endonuclease [Pseudonocardia sp. GCM10023141]|uniref:Uma2 family endonuclease n=1 Tax=Pseudonocardia sp. GCM10023141 TaxID=3252653 RepID=UPI0036190BE3
MSLSWPSHLLTLEEWDALPEDSALRLELVEGVLVTSPKPLSWHQKAATRLSYRIDEQLPDEITALEEVDVLVTVEPPTIRNPDVLVTRTDLYLTNPQRYRALDVLLAVEILSAGTRRVDRVLKFSEYAEAGIPQYWIIDIGRPTTLLAYRLDGDTYRLSGEYSGHAALDVAGHPVALDLDALIRRR